MDFDVPTPPPTVAEWMRTVPPELDDLVGRLRDLIYEVAHEVGAIPLVEELKWGQPSYRSPLGRESTPVRIGWTATGDVALLAHCQSSVVPEFRAAHAGRFRFDGDRAVLVSPSDMSRVDELADLVSRALTYRRK